MLGAGIAAIPQNAGASAPPPAVAADSSLVRDMRADARGTITTSNEASTGKVGFIRVKGAGADLLPDVDASDKAGAVAKADAYLAKYGTAFGAGKGQLVADDVQTDDLGWTISYVQSYKGIPVFGALLRAHVSKQGSLKAINGYAAPDLSLSTTPRLSPADGAARAIAFVKTAPKATDGQAAKKGTLRASSNHLMIYRTGSTKGVQGKAVLVYVVEVTDGAGIRDQVFVDANTDKIVNRYSMVDNALDRELYEESNTPANLVWAENDALDEDCTLPDAGDCADDLNIDQRNLVLSSGESYWFFKNVFGRDSYDANGATRKTVNNDPTIDCPNANWNGTTTNYCDGVTSDDVVAHEWGHAYTEYTHGLIYQWQSGALNESYSDIWGETLDLVNNREDEGEGDITAKRPVGQCSTHSPAQPLVVVHSPAAIARNCITGGASFGPPAPGVGITSDLVLGLDTDEDPADPNPFDLDGSQYDGCTPLTNAAAVVGKIVMLNRGLCGFEVKARTAEAAGAIGVIIANRDPAPFAMSGDADPDPTIPSVMIGKPDHDAIAAQIEGSAATVNVTIKDASGVRTDSYRWLMGEKSDAFGGAIRDMWFPNCHGDPGKVSDIQYVCSTDDGGGVHSNSGVPNHGYALLVDGGTFNGQTVTGIGLKKAAAIYYRAMTSYQTPVSDFADHADSLEAACADLTGEAIKELSTEPNDSTTSFNKITASDCAQIPAMAAAVELRTEPVQCDFGPQLDPATPATCGAGKQESVSFLDDFEDGISDWELDYESVFDGPHRSWKSTGDLPPGNKPAGSNGAAFGPTPDLGTCTGDESDFSSADYMISPEITVGAGITPRLVFDHNIATEIGYDGGTVLVSVNGGDLEPVPASAYVFNEPTVLASAGAGNTNPLEGLDGFTGTDGGEIIGDWGTSIIDLTQVGVAVGDEIQVAFGVGRDGCGGVVGWYVDNVKVVTCIDKVKTAPTVEGVHAPEPSTFGQASAVNVTVTGADGAGTGTVTVKEGVNTLGSGPLTAGAASVPLPANLAVGTHNLTVSYSGDGNYLEGTDSVTATVVAAPPVLATPTIKAKAQPKKVTKGDSFKSKVKVKVNGAPATGVVNILYKGKVIGTGTLANGKVTITLKAKFPVGKVTLTASYKGNSTTKPVSTTYDLAVSKKA
jgi:Zn-dependent metalloprotease